MKKLEQFAGIGPEVAAQLRQSGIRTVLDLASASNLQELSVGAKVSFELLERWQGLAKHEVEASRYRRKVLAWLAAAMGLLLATASWLVVRRVRAIDRARAYDKQGSLFSDRDTPGDYERAIAEYDNAIKLDHGDKFAYAHKGYALRQLGRYDDALAALDKAISLDPKYVWPYDERGIVLILLEKYGQAVVDFDEATASDPQYKWAYAHKGYALHRLGRYDDALAVLDEAIRIDPKYAWAYNEQGDVYSDRGAPGDYERGIADYDKAIELEPGDELAYAHKGHALRHLRRYGDALAALDKAISIDPGYAWAYAERGLIYHEYLFEYQPAYEDFKRAQQLEPEQVAHQADLAEAALTSGRLEEAYKLASRALQEDENTKGLSKAEKLSMRLVAIASLLLQGRREQAKPRLQEFVAFYRNVPADFKQTWIYSGTRNFIQKQPIDTKSRNIILELIDLLESPKSEAKIARLERQLPTLN